MLGYLSDFYSPYLSDNELENLLFKKIERKSEEAYFTTWWKKESLKKQRTKRHQQLKRQSQKNFPRNKETMVMI